MHQNMNSGHCRVVGEIINNYYFPSYLSVFPNSKKLHALLLFVKPFLSGGEGNSRPVSSPLAPVQLAHCVRIVPRRDTGEVHEHA